MKKCHIDTLSMIVTNKCNLNCDHCLRGKKDCISMADEVISHTLDQVESVGNLVISGGEPTLAIDKIEKIVAHIIDNHILVDTITLTINGTIYSEKLLAILDEIDKYIGSDTVRALFAISLDRYHLSEIEKKNLVDTMNENLVKYRESKFFFGYRGIGKKLYKQGNAENLNPNLLVPLRPIKTYITYNNKYKLDLENGKCNIGPVVTINPVGIITEADASIKNQEDLYYYGNVLLDSIEESLLDNGSQILQPKKYQQAVAKSLKKYWSYNK
ncbi:MAG: radical SAM protein [Firmicutes bacterium]|nr:radical SAM protein [Bacillota bacterium]